MSAIEAAKTTLAQAASGARSATAQLSNAVAKKDLIGVAYTELVNSKNCK